MSRSRTPSRAKAAHDLEREILMTMEVVAGDEMLKINLNDDVADDEQAAQPRLNLGPHNVSPLRGLYFDPDSDTAA
jgi:hypothetical protein